ncbi:Putative VIB-1 [[Torrubiella] hemipterigena]|uniref:Putative VIB-1 n=1 Tax=[Torrubiella] hemipterigena TaxID=1531966 RepID=A0A0A1SLE8_9HYPO|nr:Putative VIB-1 [[Torrubiella] hemipterigena]
MMTATAYPPTMTDLRGDSHSNMWSYGPAHLSSRMGSSIDAAFHSGAPQARPRTGQETLDTTGYSYNRYSQTESSPYDRTQSVSSLSSHQSYPGIKRSFSQSETPYQEIVQDLRDDGSRLTVNQDHKLLSFRRAQEKNTVVDQHGRIQQLELSAQLHGMFFLSEMPAAGPEGSPLQPELTCYRRNLFQVSGSFVTPRGPISIVNDANETVPVQSMEVTISAIESVDGNAVRLIVIPWKTPPPNSPEVNNAPDQEPPSLPLIPFQDNNPEAEGDYAVYPIGWRRLQFRIATANNGRRKELQQHFVLHLKVMGTLADNTKVVLTESTTAPIVVRGRSPRNFQARKEIPLLGSSAGSRGQALVETGVGVIAGALSKRPDGKPRGSIDMQVPRSSFTFSPPKPVGQLSAMRSNSYPTWNAQIPTTGATTYGATALSEPYPKLGLQSSSSFTEGQDPLSSSMTPSMPLSLVSMDGGRATKSPRHNSQQSVHGPITPADTPSEYRYNGAGGAGRDYYPSSATGWTTTAGEQASSLAYAGNDARTYSFSQEQYKAGPSPLSSKQDAALSGSTPVYGAAPRGSFESMNNYSWSTN